MKTREKQYVTKLLTHQAISWIVLVKIYIFTTTSAKKITTSTEKITRILITKLGTCIGTPKSIWMPETNARKFTVRSMGTSKVSIAHIIFD